MHDGYDEAAVARLRELRAAGCGFSLGCMVMEAERDEHGEIVRYRVRQQVYVHPPRTRAG